MGNGNDGLMKLSDAGPMVQQVLRIAALDDFWDHLASMEEKVYFEFEAEIQGRQTHFLIEVDKKTEDPELRDFIRLQHFAEITNTKGPTLVDAAYAEKLHKIELIATHRDGKVWIVQKP